MLHRETRFRQDSADSPSSVRHQTSPTWGERMSPGFRGPKGSMTTVTETGHTRQQYRTEVGWNQPVAAVRTWFMATVRKVPACRKG